MTLPKLHPCTSNGAEPKPLPLPKGDWDWQESLFQVPRDQAWSQPAESSFKELSQAYRAIEWTRPVEIVVEQSEKPKDI